MADTRAVGGREQRQSKAVAGKALTRAPRRKVRVGEVMTPAIETCTPDTRLAEIARMMAERNVRAVPVVESVESLVPIGIVTDRDIVVRGLTQRPIAPYKTPLTAADCMSVAVVTTPVDAEVCEAARLMEQNAVGRVVVVDDAGRCTGIVTHADLERQVPLELLGCADAPAAASLPTDVYWHVT
jgi:CBS domain-containing protein